MRKCSIDGCENKHKGHGYCSKHLSAWKRTGDPLGSRAYAGRGEALRYLLDHMHDDCPKWPYARGRGGYGRVQWNGEVHDVHTVVCEIVHGPKPSPEMVAAHDCGKGGEGCFGARCISWKTRSENYEDSVRHGTARLGEDSCAATLSDAQVSDIRDRYQRRAPGVRGNSADLASEYGVTQGYILDLVKGARRTRRLAG